MLLQATSIVLAVAVLAAPFAQQPLIFKKVDYYWMEGEDEKKKDARLVLDPVAKTLAFYDEKKGAEKVTYAVIPYDKITSITYEKSAHSRIAMGLLLSPLAFFLKGKKHWLTVQFKDVPELSAGYVYVRLDKKNFQQIIEAVEGQTGLDVEGIVES